MKDFFKKINYTSRFLDYPSYQFVKNYNDVKRRPREKIVRSCLGKFFNRNFLGCIPDYNLIEDGDWAWAFWVLDGDSTGYVYFENYLESDGIFIEFYGTCWRPRNWAKKSRRASKSRNRPPSIAKAHALIKEQVK